MHCTDLVGLQFDDAAGMLHAMRGSRKLPVERSSMVPVWSPVHNAVRLHSDSSRCLHCTVSSRAGCQSSRTGDRHVALEHTERSIRPWCDYNGMISRCACAAQEAAQQAKLQSEAARFEAEAAADAAQRKLEAAEVAASAAQREVRSRQALPVIPLHLVSAACLWLASCPLVSWLWTV